MQWAGRVIDRRDPVIPTPAPRRLWRATIGAWRRAVASRARDEEACPHFFLASRAASRCSKVGRPP